MNFAPPNALLAAAQQDPPATILSSDPEEALRLRAVPGAV